MKKRSYTSFSRGVCLFLATLVGVLLCATPALAEALDVSGADYLYQNGDGAQTVDILTVTGNEGDTVYVKVKNGQEVIADHLAFTLDDQSSQTNDNGEMVGVVSVSFAADDFSNDETYTVEVYSDRQETHKIYGGNNGATMRTVFALYEDANKDGPLAVRTLEEGEQRPFTAPQTLEYGGVAYALKSEEPSEVDGKLCYTYALADGVASSVEGHVTYYDADDLTTSIKVETVALAQGESRTVEVPSIVASDKGEMYRTLQLTGSTTLSYPGVTERSIMCKKLNDDWGSVGSFYTATIKYVNAEGDKLGLVDTVIVNKPYTYTAPDKIFVTDDNGTVQEYKLHSKGKGVLKLAPGDAKGTKEYHIVYDPVADEERTWTVVLENGSVSPSDSKREISREDFTGKPGDVKTYETKQEIEVDGVKYVPTASAQATYEHTFAVADADVEQHIYYVPDGYVEPEPYEVTVQYVNIASNEIIDQQTYTASPSMRSDLEIETPATFSATGVEWVRLNGQEAPIRHGFYSTARNYVVYYRDINDDLHEKTVIRTVRVTYVDGEGNTVSRPTTVVNNGTTDGGTATTTTGGAAGDEGATTGGAAAGGVTAGGADGTAAGGAAEGATTDTGLPTGTNVRAIDGEDGAGLATEDGQDLATTRIEDDTTPLAGPSGSEGATAISEYAPVIGGVSAAAVAAAFAVIFIIKRRKRDENDSSDTNPTA